MRRSRRSRKQGCLGLISVNQNSPGGPTRIAVGARDGDRLQRVCQIGSPAVNRCGDGSVRGRSGGTAFPRTRDGFQVRQLVGGPPSPQPTGRYPVCRLPSLAIEESRQRRDSYGLGFRKSPGR